MIEKVKKIGLPLALGALTIILLQTGIIHKAFNIKVLQLPLPSDILRAFSENLSGILDNSKATVLAAVCGLVLGSIIGYLIALLVTALPNAGYGCLILITMINSVPIVALAPLMNRWFENPFCGKLTVITIASLGSMAVNAFYGLNDVDDTAIALMHSNASPKIRIFTKLRIPNSLPSIFTALKISVSAAMTATIISEFFSSRTNGLGYMIKYTLKVGNQKQVGWAYIMAVSIFCLLLYGIITFTEKRLLRWHVSQKQN